MESEELLPEIAAPEDFFANTSDRFGKLSDANSRLQELLNQPKNPDTDQQIEDTQTVINLLEGLNKRVSNPRSPHNRHS